MNETNIHAGAKPLPESKALGDFRAVAQYTRQTGVIFWDFHFSGRMIGTVDGATEYQVSNMLCVLCNVQRLAAGDSQAGIRLALGIY
jgi:hypothetical protein